MDRTRLHSSAWPAILGAAIFTLSVALPSGADSPPGVKITVLLSTDHPFNPEHAADCYRGGSPRLYAYFIARIVGESDPRIRAIDFGYKVQTDGSVTVSPQGFIPADAWAPLDPGRSGFYTHPAPPGAASPSLLGWVELHLLQGTQSRARIAVVPDSVTAPDRFAALDRDGYEIPLLIASAAAVNASPMPPSVYPIWLVAPRSRHFPRVDPPLEHWFDMNGLVPFPVKAQFSWGRNLLTRISDRGEMLDTLSVAPPDSVPGALTWGADESTDYYYLLPLKQASALRRGHVGTGGLTPIGSHGEPLAMTPDGGRALLQRYLRGHATLVGSDGSEVPLPVTAVAACFLGDDLLILGWPEDYPIEGIREIYPLAPMHYYRYDHQANLLADTDLEAFGSPQNAIINENGTAAVLLRDIREHRDSYMRTIAVVDVTGDHRTRVFSAPEMPATLLDLTRTQMLLRDSLSLYIVNVSSLAIISKFPIPWSRYQTTPNYPLNGAFVSDSLVVISMWPLGRGRSRSYPNGQMITCVSTSGNVLVSLAGHPAAFEPSFQPGNNNVAIRSLHPGLFILQQPECGTGVYDVQADLLR